MKHLKKMHHVLFSWVNSSVHLYFVVVIKTHNKIFSWTAEARQFAFDVSIEYL